MGAPSKLTIAAAGGIDLGETYVYGFETGHVTVSGTAATLDAMSGTVTSATTNLAAGTTETWTLNNDRLTANSVIVVSMHTQCTGGAVVAVSATPGTDSASI